MIEQPLTTPQLMDRHDVTRWRTAIFAVFGMSGVALASWLSRNPAIRTLLDASTAQMGWVVFGIAVGSITGLLGSSHLIARYRPRAVMFVCLLFVPVGLLAAALAAQLLGSIIAVVIGLAVFGAANGILDVSMNVSGAANERQLGRTVMPLFHAAFSVGTMVGAGLGALAEKAGLDVLTHVSIICVLVFGATFVVIRGVPDVGADAAPEPDAAKKGWRDRLAMWRDRRTLLIGLIVLGMAFAEGSANDWLALAMVDGHGVSNSGGALILGVFLGAMTVGRIVGVKVLDRFGRVPVLRVTAGLAVTGLLIVILVPSPAVAVAGVVLWGLGASLGFPVGMSAASDDPAVAAARTSAVATVGYLAFLAGPPLIGLLGEHTGLLHALLVVVGLIALAGVLAPAAREPEKSRGDLGVSP
ncbi:MFS transporter [Nakamurella sp. YIM 132087]|uniref:MFS transporter n=1 Tax=Nakamurella alba TaxID=2665158 RepID=A0A7K1FFS9_9ACTN|nr:MFS transporter [Nakamurella alba]MTD12962.1 MFS transporter [Nakamurella alba]